MSNLIISAPDGTKYQPLESGTYTGICYGLVDLGEHYSQQYEKTSRKVLIMWEIIGETIEADGKTRPYTISRAYTASLGEKATLRSLLEVWRGRPFTPEELKGFDLENILGAPCLLGIVQEDGADGRSYSNVSTVSRMPKGSAPVVGTLPRILFSLNDPDALKRMEELPEWIQKRIQESTTYNEKLSNGFTEIDDEPLPFG